MANYYSQHGEDYLLDLMYKDLKNGFFVEVGCIDGRLFSNTLYFEEKGWTGMCVEAHPDYVELIKRNRPKSIVCHCAVGEKDEDDVIFYANRRGSLSTLDPTQEERWRRDFAPYFHGFEEKKVSKRTLTSLFREHGIKNIDILSVDIEGYEVQALRGLDFAQYRPAVIVVETDGASQEKDQDEILLPHGYIKAGRLAGNIFYTLEHSFVERISNVNTTINVIQSRHPLDPGRDTVVKKTIVMKPEK